MKNEHMMNQDSNQMQRHLAEIYDRRDPAAPLSPEAEAFAQSHPIGRREARIARSIAEGVADQPRLSVPARLRALVLDRLRRPAYRWYHIAAAGMLAALSPLIFQQAQGEGALAVDAAWMPWVYICFGLLNVMLVVPLAFHIFLNRRDDIEELGRSFDDYLEHPSRLFTRFRG